MALTVDQVLDKIGSFGRYQWILLGIFCFITVPIGTFPIMVATFITAEPDWVCVKGNNSVCNFTKPVSVRSEDYWARCHMPRDNWTFVKGFTSVVTEVMN